MNQFTIRNTSNESHRFGGLYKGFLANQQSRKQRVPYIQSTPKDPLLLRELQNTKEGRRDHVLKIAEQVVSNLSPDQVHSLIQSPDLEELLVLMRTDKDRALSLLKKRPEFSHFLATFTGAMCHSGGEFKLEHTACTIPLADTDSVKAHSHAGGDILVKDAHVERLLHAISNGAKIDPRQIERVNPSFFNKIKNLIDDGILSINN